jgi:nitrogen regulatory protein PII
VQEALSAYALGGAAGVTPPTDDTVRPATQIVPADGEMKLIRALVDHEDVDELRAILVKAGAIQIVLSEASIYIQAQRTEVFRGQRRMVEFEPRLRLEVTVAESDVQRVLHAIQRIPGASTYLQVIDARGADQRA